MKKLFALLLTVLSFSIAIAQNSSDKSEPGSMYFGVKAGIDFGSESGAGYDASGVGILIGGTFQYNITEAISAAPELFLQSSVYSIYSYKDKLNYINLPLLAKYTFQKIGVSAIAGPQLGFLISAKDANDNDIKSSYKTVNFSLALGGSYDYKKFEFGARYNIGLSNVNSGSSVTDNISGFTLSVAYKFK